MSDIQAFKTFAIENPRKVRTLIEGLYVRLDNLHQELLLSVDWADYNLRKGRIQGLKEAIMRIEDLADEERK